MASKTPFLSLQSVLQLRGLPVAVRWLSFAMRAAFCFKVSSRCVFNYLNGMG